MSSNFLSGLSVVPGIYRIDGFGHLRTKQEVQQECTQILAGDTTKKRTYFSTPDAFLDTWIDGYRRGNSLMGESTVYDKMGFELNYIDTEPTSTFFKIGTHTGVREYGNTQKIEPFLICADGNITPP